MLAYLSIFAVAVIAAVLMLQEDSQENRKKYLFLTFGYMFLLAALRSSSVGTDTETMLTINRIIASEDWSFLGIFDEKAPLYYVIIKIVDSVIPGGQGYQVITAMITQLGIAIFIFANSKNPFLSTWLYLTLYLYFESLNISRQFVAIALVAIAIIYIVRSEPRKAFVFHILAILIHSTAAVALPMIFLSKKEKSKHFIVVYLAVIIIGILFHRQLLYIFVSIFPHYGFYLDAGGLMESVGNNRKVLLTLFQSGYLVFAFILYTNNREKMPDEDKSLFQICMCLMLISIALGFAALSSLLISRLEYYYVLSFLILVPLCIEYSGKHKAISKMGIILVMTIPGLFLLGNNYGEILPYQFFWQL